MNINLLNNKNGFTIPEVILAMVLSSITIAGLYQIFQSQQHHYTAQGISVHVQQSLRSSLFLLSRDIRSARFNPTEITDPVVGIASNINSTNIFDYPAGTTVGTYNIFDDIGETDIDYTSDTDRIAFYTDKNGDNIIQLDNGFGTDGDQGEFIAYRLSGTDLQRFNSELFAVDLKIEDGWQTIATDVEALNFVLLDSAGVRTTNPSEASSVELALIIRSSKPDPDYTDPNVYTNYQGDAICPSCTGNHHRRRLMRTTIRIRNPESTAT